MMNRVTSGVSRLGQNLGGTNRQMQQSNKYAMALSTTLRYAFAGRVLFGIQSAITNLGEFKTQLGEIDALAARATGPGGNLQGLGNQLGDVGAEALKLSNKFGIAVGEVETYMQRFYTSFKPMGSQAQQTKQMEDFVNAHLSLVTVLGSRAGDPSALAGGLAALVRIMPGGEKHPGTSAEELSNYFAKIVTQSPQITGQDIAQAAGRLASAKNLSGMSAIQLLSVFGLAAKSGGSSAVITRGVQQLLGASLLHPTKPASKAIYSAAGLSTDPNSLEAMGGEKVLEKLITYVQQGKSATGQAKTNFDAVYNAFSRQESVRQFINLIANGGVPALKAYQKSLEQAAKDNYSVQATNLRLSQSLLIKMSNASKNLGISLVGGADWPLENLIARPIIATSDFAAAHRTTTQGVVGGALGLGAANALRKLGVFGKSGLGRFIGAASGVEQAAVGGAISKAELPFAISGAAGDGSMEKPLWVIISPLSWSLGGPTGMNSSGPTNTKSTADKIINDAKKGGGWGAAFAKYSGVGSALAIGAVVAGMPSGIRHSKTTLAQASQRGFMASLGHDINPLHFGTDLAAGGTSRFHQLFGGGNSKAFTDLLTLQNALKKQQTYFEGLAHMDLTLKYEDIYGTKKSLKRGVDAKLIPSAKQFPTAQGKAGSRRAAT